MKRMNQTWAPFIQVALPIVIAIFIAAWLNNRRIDTLDKRIDDLRGEIMPVLREIQAAIKELDRRITLLEQRLGPIVRA